MEIIELDYHNVAQNNVQIALCLGYFDALHIGHKELIRQAKLSGLPVGVMSFDNPPRVVLHKQKDQISITSNADKAEYLEELGVEYFYILHFDEEVAALSRYEFIDLVLKKLNPKIIYCGEDYRFGESGAGTVTYLKNYFEVNVVPFLTYEGEKVASKNIINLIRNKEIMKANLLLGRYHRVCGLVKHGYGNGTKFGFPTANIQLDYPYITPRDGVFMGYAIYDDVKYPAIMSIGTHPTVLQLEKSIIEIHIIDFNQTIYGKYIFFEFVEYMRDNIKFDNTDDLIAQLKKDRNKAKKALQ